MTSAVAIIIVNFNNSSDTIACLQSLRLLENCEFYVNMVDNSSDPEVLMELREWLSFYPRIEGRYKIDRTETGKHYLINMIEVPKNTGFAGGNNIGILDAMQFSSPKYIWLLNNDTLVKADSLNALVSEMESDEQIGACGSSLVFYNQAGILQGIGGKFDIKSATGTAIAQGTPLTRLADIKIDSNDIDYVIGASILLRSSALVKTGLLDERYFLYFEELDLANKLRAFGLRMGWARFSIVVHKEGASIGSSSVSKESHLATYFMTASYLRFMWKWHPRFIIWALFICGLKILKSLLFADRDKACIRFRAINDFLRSPEKYRFGRYRGLGNANVNPNSEAK